MSAFAAAMDALAADPNIGMDASYRAGGTGAPVLLRVVRSAPDRLHYALYVLCREQAGREASSTAAIIDSQSVKGAEKGSLRSTHTATMAARRSRARSATSLSTRSV